MANVFCVISGSSPKPRTRNNSAPYASICRSLSAGAVSTMAISQRTPAAAQYAASAAPVLPLDVARQRRRPVARRCETAAAAKRSLYEPDGLTVSSLKYRSFKPADGPIERERSSGVFPSPRLMRAASGTGSIPSAQRQMLINGSPGRETSSLFLHLLEHPEDKVGGGLLDAEPLELGRDLAAVVSRVVDDVPQHGPGRQDGAPAP